MDHEYGPSRRRLPGYDDDSWNPGVREARTRRDDGVRRVRRMSNWTAAVLDAGVAATSGYYAHAATVANPTTGYSGTTNQGQPGTTNTGHKPSLVHPIVTSGGSGVTAGGSAGGSGSSGSSGAGWRDN